MSPVRVGPFEPSVLVSRYLHTLTPTDPFPVQTKFNPTGYPLFGRGTLPFIGDYIDIAASPTIVPDGNGGWRFNDGSPLAGGEAPSTVFHAVWTDNRNVKPPPDLDWNQYTPPNSQQPPGFLSPTTCTLADRTGMRNQDVYTARIAPGGLYFTAPGNAKPLGDIQRGFVVFAQNTTYEIKRYRLTIVAPNLGLTASFGQFSQIDEFEVLTAPQSSISRTVFVESTDPNATVEVVIQELVYDPSLPLNDQAVLLAPDGATASVLLNPDPTNPNIINQRWTPSFGQVCVAAKVESGFMIQAALGLRDTGRSPGLLSSAPSSMYASSGVRSWSDECGRHSL